MRKRHLCDGIDIPEVGLGCWQLGADWGEVADSEAQAILDQAYADGVRLFDTAAGYGVGRSERLLGAFKQQHPDIVIITKSGVWRDPADPEGARKLREGALQSRENLGVETIDLLQLHCVPTPVMADDRVWEALAALRDEGIISRFGASVETIDEGLMCLQRAGLASLQIIFNCFRQRPLDRLLPEAARAGVGIIVRLPLASGLLSGKFGASTAFAENDHRNYNRDGAAFNVGETFAGLTFSDGLRLTADCDAILPGAAPLAQRAIRWILGHEAVSVVIPGASKPEQVASNVAAAALPAFSATVHEDLRSWCTSEVDPLIRGVY
ncbi:MAG: aldo/keto reductase [Planctomycetota bacterium]|jgi:aryl-alcohol dehydrogenase-like predicted oxidoreductase|nr:aldo/keto reductase [Planctomycetota bacterium]